MDTGRPNPSTEQLSRFVARHIGLNFTPERGADLRRGIAGAAREAGFDEPEAYISWLFSSDLTEAQLGLLAANLTVGETYFFRDRQAFQALELEVLPALVKTARAEGRPRLRLWSAACCTGEEAYSLAIAARRALPDWRDWKIEISGSDISPRFVRKAQRGVFGAWSFRDTAPEFRQRYFTALGDGRWEISPEIRAMVRFFSLNLAGDFLNAATREIQSADVIFCRNALIYFTAEHAAGTVRQLAACLREGGWLVVGPNELSHAAEAGLSPVHFPGAILHRKQSRSTRAETPWRPAGDAAMRGIGGAEPRDGFAETTPFAPRPRREESQQPLAAERAGMKEETRNGQIPAAPAETRDDDAEEHGPAEAAALLSTARSLADEGRLAEALVACDRLLECRKLDAPSHYLKAVIFEELGESEKAAAAFRNAVFLEPDFVLAHFGLGNLMRRAGRAAEANRCFEAALVLARRLKPDDVMSEAEGLTAGRMAEMIEALRTAEPETSVRL